MSLKYKCTIKSLGARLLQTDLLYRERSCPMDKNQIFDSEIRTANMKGNWLAKYAWIWLLTSCVEPGASPKLIFRVSQIDSIQKYSALWKENSGKKWFEVYSTETEVPRKYWWQEYTKAFFLQRFGDLFSHYFRFLSLRSSIKTYPMGPGKRCRWCGNCSFVMTC